jgi:Putative lumazine-binding
VDDAGDVAAMRPRVYGYRRKGAMHMAQVVEVSAEAKELIDDYDAICQAVQLYIDGSRQGDASKLKQAFHPDARMFGSLAGTRYDVHIQALFDMSDGAPADTGSYRGRIVSVQQTGDAAVATLAEDGFWGTVSFVDYFLLAKIDGSWKIVCKLFAHTGGELPAHEGSH